MERRLYYLFVEPAEKIDSVCSQSLIVYYHPQNIGGNPFTRLYVDFRNEVKFDWREVNFVFTFP